MKKNLFRILTVGLAFFVLTACAGKDKIKLQLNLQEGDSYNMRVVIDQKIFQTIIDQNMDMTQLIDIGYYFNVEEVDADGNYRIRVTYHSISHKENGLMGEVEYDSANPSEAPDPLTEPIRKAYAALLGQSFFMTITPEGEAEDIEGVDAIIAKILEQSDAEGGVAMDLLESSLKKLFGDQALKEMMGNMLSIYPDKPVRVGDSWSRKIVLEKGLPMIINNTWTLKERREGVAFIEVDSTVEPNPDAPSISMMTVKMRYNMTGTQKGTIEVQEDTGWIIRSKLDQNFSGEMMARGLFQSKGVSWPITIEGVVRQEPFDSF